MSAATSGHPGRPPANLRWRIRPSSGRGAWWFTTMLSFLDVLACYAFYRNPSEHPASAAAKRTRAAAVLGRFAPSSGPG